MSPGWLRGLRLILPAVLLRGVGLETEEAGNDVSVSNY